MEIFHSFAVWSKVWCSLCVFQIYSVSFWFGGFSWFFIMFILFFPSGVPSDLHRYSLAFSADGRWLFSMAAEERKGSKGSSGRSNELTATTSPLCAWRLDDAKLKAGLQPRASHLRLAMKEKVRLVPHPEEGIPWECGACLLETSIHWKRLETGWPNVWGPN